MIGKTKARAVRMEATSELAKYYVGDVAIPIEIYLSKKTQETAYRGLVQQGSGYERS